jgi:hypothetical protein
MKHKYRIVALGGLCLISAQVAPAPQAAPQAPVPVVEEAVHIAPELQRRFGLVEGLQTLGALAEEQRFPEAQHVGEAILSPGPFSNWRRELELDGDSWWLPLLEASDPLIDFLRLSGLRRRERAHVHYALGVVAFGTEEPARAYTEFLAANARAGVGTLREDAAYNLGTMALFQGEAWRSQMPEFGGVPAAPQAPSGPVAPGAEEETPPDPLEEARKAYLQAKQALTLRLRMDWQDADTRANMELVMRRLRELDEIERQREEQEQEQEQEDQESDESEDQDEENEDQQESDEEQDEKSDESEEPEESEPESEEENEEEQQEEEQEPESSEEQEQEEGEPSDEEEQEPQEIYLTKEEVQRLLERLERHEEKGEELRERRRGQRRPTARDW